MRRFSLGQWLLVWLVVASSANAAEDQADRADDALPPGAVARLGSVRLRHGDIVQALAFTPDGRGLLAGAQDGSLVLWDVATGRERLRLLEKGLAISAVAVSPDGKFLASCIGGSQVVLWDARGQRIDSWQLDSESSVQTLLFLLDGHTLLMLGDKWTGRDIRTGRLRPLLEAVGSCACAVVAPNGRTLAILTERSLLLYDLPSGKLRVEIGPARRSVLAFGWLFPRTASSCFV